MLPRPGKDHPAATTIAGRPLSMHTRNDVAVQRQQFQGRDCVVIKDPLTMQYYRFEEEDYRMAHLATALHSREIQKTATHCEELCSCDAIVSCTMPSIFILIDLGAQVTEALLAPGASRSES